MNGVKNELVLDGACCINCCDTHKHHCDNDLIKLRYITVIIGMTVFAAAALFELPSRAEFGLYFISYIFVGGTVLLRACKNILNGKVFDENFLMSIATVGAFAIKEFPEAITVMLFIK